MTDTVDKTTRSRIMRSVPRAHTKPECALRLPLHAMGFRYRLGGCRLHGSPDLVLARFNGAIFVHGCFWHRHYECRYATTPSTRTEFWQAKFAANIARDSAVQGSLLKAGWRVATIWECALRKPEQVAAAVDQLSTWLFTEVDTLEVGESEVTALPRGS
ncbi:very short patch repair endonuclease [Roseovarius sp.]|uniref:very short patch repair endonuclease n=1 Tax=Roseovarius sp. TaxID=1486281 RepID=UPI003561EA96